MGINMQSFHVLYMYGRLPSSMVRFRHGGYNAVFPNFRPNIQKCKDEKNTFNKKHNILSFKLKDE
jgi:hypothetical protein